MAVVIEMLEKTRFEQLLDKSRLHSFARQFEACCLKLTGRSFDELWKHRIISLVEDYLKLSLVNGQHALLLLQLLRLPGNKATIYLDHANSAMESLGHPWALLINRAVKVVVSDLCSFSTEL